MVVSGQWSVVSQLNIELAQHDCYPFAGWDMAAIWGDYYVAIGAGSGCDVA